ncbi:MAG: MBL fold metallo-hydrolase [Verrucomicrobia bacterium]|nr:MBL fold metallo-hydrolase [Verrucomicrobiota bacterium]
MLIVEMVRFEGSLAANLGNEPAGVELYWLGQAGFLVRSPALSFVIDAYLSDQLAEKYRGGVFSHARLMAPPITVAELPSLDFVFCTHHHGDHLDVPTIREVARKFSHTRFVVPAASESEIGSAGLRKGRIVWAEADRAIQLSDTLKVTPVKAAHEGFEYDQFGRDRFLGYVFEVEAGLIYHSGDTVRYPGLVERIIQFGPQLALLPVNGRRSELREKKIPGNFTLEEAIQFCLDGKIPTLIAHHFGMFAFNTIDPELIGQAATKMQNQLQLIKSELGTRYFLKCSARGSDFAARNKEQPQDH